MNKENKTALLIIDMINTFDFIYGDSLAKKAEKITEPILSLRKSFRDKNWPVIYINDHYNLWQADFEKIMDYCRNERSRTIIDRIGPGEEDFFLIKPKHSAFYGTALHTLLQQLGVEKLILTGVAGNICVLFTANDAYMREYELSIPSDCIASNTDHDDEYALMMMVDVLGADTRASTEIDLTELGA
ncbi:cysteine hydrolase family protein [Bacillus massilinigeriensis]|uniref:cysteine hydrolase family protein n=1 Tax=Bacillus mediterraneensis TaxID=1805474 RepID=UPI0008F8B478|nr:isochorismatase family cysteine hydrolase [Bacillus mediterraneensis]